MRSAVTMQVLLQCGHRTVWIYRTGVRIPPPTFVCPECNADHEPVAMESREWHAKCSMQGCSWGRWAGQSEDTAKRYRRDHWRLHTRHVTSLGYVPVPDKVEMIREAYGRKFPIGIVGNPK